MTDLTGFVIDPYRIGICLKDRRRTQDDKGLYERHAGALSRLFTSLVYRLGPRPYRLAGSGCRATCKDYWRGESA